MSDREITSVTDVQESDVQTAYEFTLLVEALAEMADEDTPSYKRSFDKAMLQSMAQSSRDLYQQLAVVYAHKKEIDPTELVDTMETEWGE